MLTIREEQLTAFSDHETRKFEDWMVLHLQRFFPTECDRLGGHSHVRDLVRHGIRQSVVYGIARKCDVCKYVDVMMVLGRDFDVDARLGWVSAILAGPGDVSYKISALHESTRDHLRRR